MMYTTKAMMEEEQIQMNRRIIQSIQPPAAFRRQLTTDDLYRRAFPDDPIHDYIQAECAKIREKYTWIY